MANKGHKGKHERRPKPSRVRGELLALAHGAMEAGDWEEALPLLERLRQRDPDDVAVLRAQAEVLGTLGRSIEYLGVVQRLARLRPDAPDLAYGLAEAYAQLGLVMLARSQCQRILQRFPESELAPRAREILVLADEMRETRRPELAGLSAEQIDAAIELEDEMRLAMVLGRFEEATAIGEKVRALAPDLVSNLNNLSTVLSVRGQLDAALLVSRDAVQRAPHPPYALAEHTRTLLLSGRVEEARAMAERLKAAPLDARRDYPLKVAEALSFLGDDQGVLEAFAESQRLGPPDRPVEHAQLLHLAAVASYRMGEELPARQRWAEARRLAPNQPLYADNLAEIDQLVGRGHGPWAHPLSAWLPAATLEDFLAAGRKAKTEAAFERVIAEFLRAVPQAEALLPFWLDGGPPPLRTFASLLAHTCKTPAALAALRDFALSRRGPDEMRREALHAAVRAGLLSRAPTRLWLEGEWKGVLPLAWELVPDTETSRPELPPAEQALALRLRDELPPVLLSRGLRIPWAPEAWALHERFPDAVMPAVLVALCEARRGRLAGAEAVLQPFLLRERLRVRELCALCQAQVEIAAPRADRVELIRWLKMWHAAAPQDPVLRSYMPLLGVAELGERIGTSLPAL